ncbi:HGxxPAAW family protein [Streptomyces sp. NPDC091280]|uniref:HGxxPAAW family protein n=1 Tax=Streptomyces sp. NPDC091280 TaxID=3365984 RepID=UPI00381827C2
MSAHQYDEGHTVAGWTGCGIATVGTAVAGAGVCTVSAALISGGLAIVVVGVLVTWALHLTGWGKPPGRRDRAQWGMRVRDPLAAAGHAGCVGCRLAGRGRPAPERTDEERAVALRASVTASATASAAAARAVAAPVGETAG